MKPMPNAADIELLVETTYIYVDFQDRESQLPN